MRVECIHCIATNFNRQKERMWCLVITHTTPAQTNLKICAVEFEKRMDTVRTCLLRANTVRISLLRADTVRTCLLRANTVRISLLRADTVRTCLLRAKTVRISLLRADTVRTCLLRDILVSRSETLVTKMLGNCELFSKHTR